MDVDERSFEEDVLAASAVEPVVVDFWAAWCGPCRALGPLLEQATGERSVRLAKVDVDANPALAQRYGVSGIPAVKAFRRGEVVAEFVGAQPRAAVEAFLDELTRPPLAETVDDAELAELLRAGDHEAALELLLGRVAADPDGTRELMVRLFAELGHEHELTQRYRRRLAAALY